MSTFVILARKHWGDKCLPLSQVRGTENRAVNLAQNAFKNGGMNRVMVVDDKFKIIFKQDRRCKCTNSQYEISGHLVCQECRRIIATDKYKMEEYQ